MEKLPSISDLVKDRARFDSFVYTPIREAIQELARRSKDQGLTKKIENLLHGDIPEPLSRKPRAVIFRQLKTPNYEMRRFVSLVEGLGKLEPLFWEYAADKFTPNNEYKRALGKLLFFGGKGKKGGSKIDALNIIDFNQSNGKQISSLLTLWGQNFVDFHHEFFDTCFRSMPGTSYDSSDWFSHNGRSANGYYKSFLALFIKHGILFENFLLDETEFTFTKDIVLPAFLSVYSETGLKPLVVALEPTSIEGDKFWLCYPGQDRRNALFDKVRDSA